MTARTVCGCTPSNLAAMPRDPLTIAGDLRHAAEHLVDLADDFAAGVFDDVMLSSAESLLLGAGRLILDLRARHRAQGGTHA